MNIKYTKEEREKLNNCLNVITDDLRRIWSNSGGHSKEFSCKFDHKSGLGYIEVGMNSFGIWVVRGGFAVDYSKKFIERQTPFGTLKRKISLENTLEIIANYDVVRTALKSQIERDINEKNKHLACSRYIEEKYSASVDLELELPKTNNVYTVEVTKEDGKNIGTLKLGGQTTLRIVSSAPITVVNKNQPKELSEPKVKSKTY